MFELISTVIFAILGVLWQTDTLPDFCGKIFFFAVAFWGIFETAVAFGYLVKL